MLQDRNWAPLKASPMLCQKWWLGQFLLDISGIIPQWEIGNTPSCRVSCAEHRATSSTVVHGTPEPLFFIPLKRMLSKTSCWYDSCRGEAQFWRRALWTQLLPQHDLSRMSEGAEAQLSAWGHPEHPTLSIPAGHSRDGTSARGGSAASKGSFQVQEAFQPQNCSNTVTAEAVPRMEQVARLPLCPSEL